MTRWEYRTAPTVGADLVTLGNDGWELVCMDSSSLIFKRPVEPVPADEPAETEEAAVGETTTVSTETAGEGAAQAGEAEASAGETAAAAGEAATA